MAHSANIISKVKLPGSSIEYEIHDEQAIHSIEELGLSAALVFKGTKATVSELPSTGNKVGDVWHVTADDFEYVWTQDGEWEELGRPYNFASDSHTHSFSKSVTLSGTATGSVTVPTISETKKYLKVSSSATQGAVTAPTSDFVTGGSVSVSGGVASTTNIKATATGAAVGANGTASAITAITPTTDTYVKTVPATDVTVVTGVDSSTGEALTGLGTPTTADAITGFGTHTTAKAATALNTTSINNPTVTAVSIPNVTGNTNVTIPNVTSVGSKGTAASWGATVSDDGVLEFSWTANTPTTTPTLGTALSASKVTLGTAISASSVATSAVTVATGIKSTANAITALGTPTTAAAITNITPTTGDFITEVDGTTGTASKLGTPTTGSAVTGLGTPTKATVLTGVKVTAQPTIALATGATAGTGVISVATGVSAITAAFDPETSKAVTSVSVGAPTVTTTLAAGTSSDGVYSGDDVTIGSTSASLTGGAASVSGTVSGSTGQPQ